MVINRRSLRGYNLDDECKEYAEIVREVDGPGDPRKFCSGYSDGQCLCSQCEGCGAYAENATPWKGERFGVLPGQITIDEILEREGNEHGGKSTVDV